MIVYGVGWPWDLEQTATVLSVVGGIAAVAAALWGLLKGLHLVWNRTVGARRSQRRLVARLFPGANLEYVDAVLGPATLITHTQSGRAVFRYRLLDCWVSVGEEQGAAEWISITVTDPAFILRTDRFTEGLVDVRLGRDCFDKAGRWFGSGVVSIGQKEQSYVERNDGPTAQRSQKSLLGYTRIGVGNLEVKGDILNSPTVVREETTINTLAIARPFGDLPSEALLGFQEVQHVPLGRRRPLSHYVQNMQTKRLLRRLG